MATGSGKTFIAIMLILRMFGSENDRGIEALTADYTRLRKQSN